MPNAGIHYEVAQERRGADRDYAALRLVTLRYRLERAGALAQTRDDGRRSDSGASRCPGRTRKAVQAARERMRGLSR